MPDLDYPRLTTARLVLVLPEPDLADRMVDYYRRNRAHLAPWEPRRAEEFLTVEWWERQLRANLREFEEDRGVRLAILRRDDPTQRVIGVANISNVVRGAFQACHLGYSIDRECEGQGYMREALEALIRYAFRKLHLHRILASYQPENGRSEVLLERLGFRHEGYAVAYLHIDGDWRDHVLTALVAGDEGAREAPDSRVEPTGEAGGLE